MSIPVPLDRLRAAMEERGASSYILTVSDDSRPHAVHASVTWDGNAICCEVGKRSAANAAARPLVSLLFPAVKDGDYSLIIDGTARVDTQRLLITPTKAVLHRPATVPNPDATCKDDCVPLLREPPTT